MVNQVYRSKNKVITNNKDAKINASKNKHNTSYARQILDKFLYVENNDKRLGWLPQPRNTTIRKRNGPDSARKAFRAARSLIDKRVLISSPSELLLDPITDLYGPNNYCLQDIDPKLVHLMLFRYTNETLYVKNLPEQMYFKHKYLDENISQDQFTGECSPEPSEMEVMIAMAMEEPIPEPADDATKAEWRVKGEQLLHAVLNNINMRFKNLDNYLNMNWRRGYVTQTLFFDGVSYGCNKYDESPIYKCSCCNHLNAPSSISAKPADSTKYYDTIAENYNEEEQQYITKGRGMDEKFMVPKSILHNFWDKPVAPGTWDDSNMDYYEYTYRCEFCWASLEWIFEQIHDPAQYALTAAKFDYLFGLSVLDQLLMTNVGDTYEVLDAPARQALIANDDKIVKKFLRSIPLRSTELPHNISQVELLNLSSHYPGLHTRCSNSVTSVCPAISAELRAAQTWLYCALGEPTQTVMLRTTEQMNFKHFNYMESVEWLTRLCREQMVDFPVGAPIIVGEALCNPKMLHNIAASGADVIYFILIKPNIENPEKEMLQIVTQGQQTELFVDGKSNPLVVSTDAYDMLTNYDVILNKDGTTYVNSVMHRGSWVEVHSLTRVATGTDLDLQRPIAEPYMYATLPTPDTLSIMGNWFPLNVKLTRCKINKKLLRALCLRNLAGNMGTEALQEYAVAYSNTTYNVGGHLVQAAQVDFEEIDLHVVLCNCLCAEASTSTEYSYRMNEIINYLGPLRGLVMDKLGHHKDLTLNYIMSWCKTKLKDVMSGDISKVLQHADLSTWIRDVESVNLNGMMEELITDMSLSNLKIYTTSTPTMTTNVAICKHHNTTCIHHHTGNSVCACCGQKSNATMCDCCKTVKTTGLTYDTTFTPLIQRIQKTQRKAATMQHKSATKATTKQQLVTMTETVPTTLATDTERTHAKAAALGVKVALEEKLHTQHIKLATGMSALDLQHISNDTLDMLNNYVTYAQNINPVVGNTLYLPGMAMGTISVFDNFSEIINKLDQTNEALNSCGYNALKAAVNVPDFHDLNTFQSIVGQESNFATDEITKFCAVVGLNVIIYCDSHLVISHNTLDDFYYTIAHSSKFGEVIEHYYHVQVRLTNRPSIALMPVLGGITWNDLSTYIEHLGLSRQYYFREFNYEENLGLIVHITNMVTEHDQNQSLGVVTKIGGTSFWQYPTNNTTHLLEEGLICVEIGAHLLSDITDFVYYPEQPELANIRHNIADLPANIETDLTKMAIGEMNQYRKHKRCVLTGEITKLIKEKFTATTRPSKLGTWIQCKEHGFKTFDMVYIHYTVDGTSYRELTTINKTEPLRFKVQANLSKADKVHVSVFKQSTGSMIRKLAGICGIAPTKEDLVSILQTTVATIGYPGTGKTTQLLNEVKEGDLIITMTRGNRENLQKSKLPKGVQILSAEKAMNTKLILSDTSVVYLDEATMLDYTILLPLLKYGASNLQALGDPCQVGFIDMSADAGLRHEINIVDLVKMHGKVQEKTKTYRFGEPAISELKVLLPNIEAVTNTQLTGWSWTNINSGAANIVKLVEDKLPNVVICMYQEIKSNLKLVLETYDIAIDVHTTHSCQGKEWDNVMVVLQRTTTGKWGLNGDSNYLTSALTRAKRNMHIVVIDEPTITNLPTAITKQGGNSRHAVIQMALEDYRVNGNNAKFTRDKTFLENNTTITQEGEKLILKSDTTYGRIELEYSEKLSILTKPSWVPEHKIINSVIKNLETLYMSKQHIVDPNTITGKLVEFKQLMKLRLLNWMCESNMTGKIELTYVHGVLTVEKKPGCSLMAGCVIKYNSGWLQVRPQYRTMLYRDYTAGVDYDSTKLHDWLVHDDYQELFGSISSNFNIQLKMWLERISKTKQIWDVLGDDEIKSCEHVRVKQTSIMQTRFPKVKMTKDCYNNLHGVIVTNVNTSMPKWVKRNGMCNSLKLEYVNHVETISYLDSHRATALFNTILHDIRNNTSPTFKVFGTDFQLIKGLGLSIEDHYQHKTIVGQKLTAMQSQLKMLEINKVTDILWLSTEDNQILSNFKEQCPNLAVNNFGGHKMMMGLVDALENYGTFVIGKHTGGEYCYGGLLPYAPAYQNQHYASYLTSTTACLRQTVWQTYAPLAIANINQYLASTNSTDKVNSMAQVAIDGSKLKAGDTINLGCDFVSADLHQLLEWVLRGVNVYGWVPMAKTSKWYSYNNGQIAYYDAPTTQKLSDEILFAANYSSPIEVKNDYLGLNEMAIMFDHMLVKCELLQMPCRRLVTVDYHQPTKIKMRLPLIDFNLKNWLTAKPILVFKEVNVDTNLYRKIMLRLIAKPKTFQDVLAYARSLASANLTSKTYIGETTTVDPITLINTAQLAMTHRANIFEKFKYVQTLAQNISEHKLLKPFMSELLTYLAQFLEGVSEFITNIDAPGLIEQMVTSIKGVNLKEWQTANANLKILLQPLHGKIVEFNNQQAQTQHAATTVYKRNTRTLQNKLNVAKAKADPATTCSTTDSTALSPSNVSNAVITPAKVTKTKQTNLYANVTLSKTEKYNMSQKYNRKSSKAKFVAIYKHNKYDEFECDSESSNGSVSETAYETQIEAPVTSDKVLINKPSEVSKFSNDSSNLTQWLTENSATIINSVVSEQPDYLVRCEKHLLESLDVGKEVLLHRNDPRMVTRVREGGKNFLIHSLGSTGDIRPLLCVAACLKQGGYTVTFFTHYDHVNIIPEEYGFFPIPYSIHNQLNACLQLFCPEAGTKLTPQLLESYLHLTMAAVIGDWPKQQFMGMIAGAITPGSERLAAYYKCPLMWFRPYPWLDLPSTSLKMVNTWLNKLIQKIISKQARQTATWSVLGEGVDTRLDFDKQIIGFSPELVEKVVRNNYATNNVCGPLTGKSNYTGSYDEQLLDLLQGSERSWGCVAYGSVSGNYCLKVLNLFITAARKLKHKLVVSVTGCKIEYEQSGLHNCTGFGMQSDKLIFIVPGFSYSRILGKLAFIVNHGGAGVFSECVTAGTPLVSTPIFGDQPIWIGAAEYHGFGIEGSNYYKLNSENVYNLLSKVKQTNHNLIINAAKTQSWAKNITHRKLFDILSDNFNMGELVNDVNINPSGFGNILHREPLINQNNDWDYGCYNCEIYDLDLKLNPPTGAKCALSCIATEIGDKSVMQQPGLGHNVFEILEVCSLYRLNLVWFNVTTEDEQPTDKIKNAIFYNLLPGTAYVIIGIKNGNVSHALLFSGNLNVVDKLNTNSEFTPHNPAKSLEVNTMQLLADLDDSNLHINCDELRAKMKLPQLFREWVTKYQLFAGEWKIIMNENWELEDVNAKHQHLTLCICFGETGICFGLLTGHAEPHGHTTSCQVKPFADVGHLIMCADMLTRWENIKIGKNLKKIISLSSKGKYCLTKTDQQELASLGIMCNILELHNKGVLYVENFDNRSQHGRPVKDIYQWVENNSCTSATAQAFFDMDIMVSSADKPFNRCNLQRGKLVWVAEFTTPLTAQLIAAANRWKCKGTNVIYDTLQPSHKFADCVTITSESGAMLLKANVEAEMMLMLLRQRASKRVLDLLDNCSHNIVDDISLHNVNIDWLEVTNTFQTEKECHLVTTKRMTLLLLRNGVAIVLKKVQGGEPQDFGLPIGKHHKQDWWHSKDANVSDTMTESIDYTFLEDLSLKGSNVNNHYTEGGEILLQNEWKYLTDPDNSLPTQVDNTGCLNDLLDIAAVNFWDTNDITHLVMKRGPITQGKLISRETPGRIIQVRKHTMTKYPSISRPVLTKLIYMEHNAITGRLMSVADVRVQDQTPTPLHVINNMGKAYFVKDWEKVCNGYQSKPIGFDIAATRDWVNAHHNSERVYQDLKDFVNGDLATTHLNDINVHLKLESLYKPGKEIFDFSDQQARTIMWQNYYVAAIYSPIFMLVKDRLKQLLRPEVIYADGYTPAQLNAILSTTQTAKVFFESDLSQQDRQTDKPIIDVEMALYQLLGVGEQVLHTWRHMHEHWRFKSNYAKGHCYSMRLTGQATTALGNVITNMQVHAEFVLKNKHLLCYIIMLGDDNNMGFVRRPDVTNLTKDIAVKFNMQSKNHMSEFGGGFCSMIVHPVPGHGNGIGPDYVRMRHRFEVTNGVHESTEENIQMRAQSYCCMLGALPGVMNVIEMYKWPIEPLTWYNYDALLSSTANIYKLSTQEIEDECAKLVNMIAERTVHEHVFECYGQAKI